VAETNEQGNLTGRCVFSVWWPLAASWLLMALELPALSAVLTRMEDPQIQLAAWGGVIFPICLIVEAPIIMLLAAYFIMDTYYYRKEGAGNHPAKGPREPIKLEGTHNFILLAGIVGAVLLSGVVNWGELNTLGVHRGVQDWVRDALLVIIGAVSLITTRTEVREDNNFTWAPIVEVALLFIGIFITMLPCLLILKAGPNGAMAFLINAVNQPVHYFWATGALSAFLDNAPTYQTVLSTARGSFYPGVPESVSVVHRMGEMPAYPAAVSAGSVFFGACSYIGNAPNFMVRSIAEEAGTKMPSFFGYVLKYALVFLVPCFVVVTFVFF